MKKVDKKHITIALIAISLIIIIIGILILLGFDKANRDNIDYTEMLHFTTNKGNLITTIYQDFDGFQLKIPNDFVIMEQELVNLKYPSENRPSIVYTNEDGTININIKITDTTLKNDEIEKTVKQTENMFKKIDENTEINYFIRNDHNLGEVKMVSGTIDKTAIYNHMLMFSVNDKMTVISFNCLETQVDEWQEVGEFIIKSIKFE